MGGKRFDTVHSTGPAAADAVALDVEAVDAGLAEPRGDRKPPGPVVQASDGVQTRDTDPQGPVHRLS